MNSAVKYDFCLLESETQEKNPGVSPSEEQTQRLDI